MHNGINIVTVRWFDGYMEEFEATEVRFGSDLLWMRLANGQNRHIPLRPVRWFGMSQESHQTTPNSYCQEILDGATAPPCLEGVRCGV